MAEGRHDDRLRDSLVRGRLADGRGHARRGSPSGPLYADELQRNRLRGVPIPDLFQALPAAHGRIPGADLGTPSRRAGPARVRDTATVDLERRGMAAVPLPRAVP